MHIYTLVILHNTRGQDRGMVNCILTPFHYMMDIDTKIDINYGN